MTISSFDNRRSYAGNGSTTVFAFPPPFTANADLVVQAQAADGTVATRVLGADYTVSGAGNPGGGTVTLLAPPAIGTTLIVYRDVPITQSVALLDGGPLPAASLNGMFDRVTMWGQRLKEQVTALSSMATATFAGLMSAADKAKLDGIAPGAQVNTVTSVAGKTGAVTVTKADVGLASADDTADAGKPVSTAQQAALDLKADKSALAAVATTGAYGDLGGRPALGSAAATDASAYATAAQGAKADASLQGLQAGTNISIDATDPAHPRIYATGEAGGGDVSGPASAADGRIAVYDGPTGKVIADGGVAISDLATASQGAKADSAVQPSGLSGFATQSYVDAALSALSSVYQAAASILSSIAGLTSNGLVARTADGSVAARTLTASAGGLVANGDGVAGDPTVGPDIATAANYRAATANKMLDAANTWAAAALQTLTSGTTISMSSLNGWNGTLTLATNGTLANPTSLKAGQTGAIQIKQNATGARTLAYGTAWKFAGGTAPILSTAPNATDVLYYFVIDATTPVIHASLSKGVA